MTVRQIPIIFILLLMVSCKQSVPLTQEEKTNIADSIRETLKNYYNDITKYGLTAELNYLDNSPDFFWVPPGYSGAISYDSVVAVLQQNAPMYKTIVNSFDTLKIIPLSKDIATYTTRLQSAMTDTAGKTFKYSLIETGVLIRRQNGWKLLSGQTSILQQE